MPLRMALLVMVAPVTASTARDCRATTAAGIRSIQGSMKPGVSEQSSTTTERILVSSTVTATLVGRMVAGEPKRSPSMVPLPHLP